MIRGQPSPARRTSHQLAPAAGDAKVRPPALKVFLIFRGFANKAQTGARWPFAKNRLSDPMKQLPSPTIRRTRAAPRCSVSQGLTVRPERLSRRTPYQPGLNRSENARRSRRGLQVFARLLLLVRIAPIKATLPAECFGDNENHNRAEQTASCEHVDCGVTDCAQQ